MSRDIQNFTGNRVTPPVPALWTFQHKVIGLTGPLTAPFALYPPPGPVMVEWFMIEADYRNKDVILIGEKNEQVLQPSASISVQSLNCIATLGPSESLIWEPNDKGKGQVGMMTLPDAGVIQIALTPDVDLVDVTQFFALMVNNNVTCTLHTTIGNRSRR